MFESDFFKQLLSNLISISVVGGLIIWLLKELISKFLKSDTEKFKHKLQAELEFHKSKLQFEYHRNTKLHNEQCEFIKSLFQRLSSVDILLENLIRLVEEDRDVERRDKETIMKPLVSEIFEMEKFFKTNKILINEVLSKKVQDTIELLFKALKRTSLAFIVKSKDHFSDSGEHLGIVNKKLSELNSDEKIEFESIIREVKKLKEINIKESLNELEISFRNVYGVE